MASNKLNQAYALSMKKFIDMYHSFCLGDPATTGNGSCRALEYSAQTNTVNIVSKNCSLALEGVCENYDLVVNGT